MSPEQKRIYEREYYKRNKARRNETNKAWKAANKERLKEYWAKHYAKHRDKTLKKNAEWLKRNPKYAVYKTQKRRGKKYQATPKWADTKQIKDIYLNCPEGCHVDHIIPLCNENVCGLHVEYNLQYLSKKDNNRKKNSFDGTYSNESWRNK